MKKKTAKKNTLKTKLPHGVISEVSKVLKERGKKVSETLVSLVYDGERTDKHGIMAEIKKQLEKRKREQEKQEKTRAEIDSLKNDIQ